MIESGLASKDGRSIPLRGVAVKAEVLGGHARVIVRQRYKNVETCPVEAIYTFPLPADATLAGFAMVCEGRRLEGEVQEREAAFRAYDDALVGGHGAALLEQERANVFTANVGNLLPNEETVIEVEYLQRLQAEEGALRWMLPTLVAPRYIPGAIAGDRTGGGFADPTTDVPDADRITPKIGHVDYGLTLELVFSLAGSLEVESPSHAIRVFERDGRTHVAFSREEVALDRDVVITARNVAEGLLAGVAAHRNATDPGYFALTVVPDLFAPDRPAPRQQVVFLIDTSGSMDGASIVEAKAALRLCLRHLRAGDLFNVIEFNSSHRSFSPSPIAFGEQSLTRADRWVDSLQANGGTELLQPLLQAARDANGGVVVLLTDGQVGNEKQILEEVLAARGQARFYSFGIGTNVSDALLRDLARQTGGGVEFIHPGERIDDKVVAIFAKAVAPRVDDVQVRFVGLEVGEVSPQTWPALVDGEPWVVFGRYASPGRGSVEIRGKQAGMPFKLDVPIDLPASVDRPVIGKLWATERIRDFEATEVTGRRAGAMKDRIVKLAVEHGVSSPYTSFVVVEHRTGDRLAQGTPEARFVPVNVPAGWAMFEKTPQRKVAMAPMIQASYAMSPSMPMSSAPTMAYDRDEVTSKIAPAGGGLGGFARGLADGAKKAMAGPSRRRKEGVSLKELGAASEERELAAPKGGADEVGSLLARQKASGLWEEASAANDTDRLRATARALLTLLDAGVTTTHALHGAQVKKAVEALIQLAGVLAEKEPPLVEFALGVAWLVATGKRTRGAIEGIVKKSAALAGLSARLADSAALRAFVEKGRG